MTLFPLFLLSLILKLALVLSITLTQTSKLQLYSANDPQPSRTDSILRMQSNDAARHSYLASHRTIQSSGVPIASGRTVTLNPTYIVGVNIGTPPQTLLMALDTNNDAAWVPCTGCVGCSATTFDPSKSTTLQPVACGASQCSQVPNPSCGATSCGFNINYGGSTIAATLMQDNITLGNDTIPNYTLGCVQSTTGSSPPAQGLLGLGRGPLSLLTQTSSLYQSTFSYCLPSYKSPNFSGSLWLGANNQPKKIRSTQLLRNPRRSSFYYVNLVGIKVGGKGVQIPPTAFAFDPTNGGGTVFDSGTVFTTLVKSAYIAMRDEFRRQMGNATVSALGGFDTCYTVPITVTTITFRFSGGLNMVLPPDNFIIRSSAGTTSCLAMAAAADNGVNSVLSVIASYQQQNFRILIDVPNSKVGIARQICS